MKKIITTSTILFLGVMFLAGCTGQKNNQNPVQQKIQKQETVQQEEEKMQRVSPEEMVEFEHPGSDEVGRKVEGMDSLINATSTSGYDEDASGEVLSELE